MCTFYDIIIQCNINILKEDHRMWYGNRQWVKVTSQKKTSV